MTQEEIKEREIIIWRGEQGFFKFAENSAVHDYKYIVKCTAPEGREEFQEELGAACINTRDLADICMYFSDKGYLLQIGDLEYVKSALTKD